MQAGIYKIYNIQNGKCYVGSTIDFEMRKAQHFTKLRHNKHHSKHLQNAWNKYGEASFRFDIIEIIEITDNIKAELLFREQFWLDAINPEYNILKTAYSSLGYKHTKETKEKISKTTKGKKKSEAHAQHIKEAQKGKTLTEEHKNKLKEAAKHRNNDGYKQKVQIYGVVYDSVQNAAKILGMHRSTISKKLKDKNNNDFIKLNS